MNKISVIVPVYGVEKYIRQCIESIQAQTYGNLEIILIDDESPDHCGEICDEYAEKDSRIIVIHQKNGGAAAARNAGMAIASGDYLAFVDGDDYILPEMYEILIQAVQENDADLVQCGFTMSYKDHADNSASRRSRSIYSAEVYLERYTQDWTCALLWDKLFKRELFMGIQFEVGHKIDDEFFTYRGVMRAKRIAAIPDCLYIYRQRASSVMYDQCTEIQKIADKVEALTIRRRQVVGSYPTLRKIYNEHYVDTMLAIRKSPFASTEIKKSIKHLLLLFCLKGEAFCISLNLKKAILLCFVQSTQAGNLLQSDEKKDDMPKEQKILWD